VISHEDTNAKCFSEKVKDIATKTRDLSVKLVENCSHVINKAKQHEINVGCPVIDIKVKDQGI
jgi:hypothetical protein